MDGSLSPYDSYRLRKLEDVEASPQLMYGNLVCVSINRMFDDVIWATVSISGVDQRHKTTERTSDHDAGVIG